MSTPFPINNAVEFPYFIADSHSGFILLWLPDERVASALAEGMLNLVSYSLLPFAARRIDVYKEHIFREGVVQEAPPDRQPDAEVEAKRALLRERLPAMQRVLSFAARQGARASVFVNPRLEAALAHAVNASNPQRGDYHPAVLDYATITGMAPAAAYAEMRTRLDSMAMVIVRNYLFVERAVRQINAASTRKEAMKAARALINDARVTL
jgi:hypothetical protein